jgi:hypothetical protein
MAIETQISHLSLPMNGSRGFIGRLNWVVPAVALLGVFAGLSGAQWHHLASHDASAWSTYYDAALEIHQGRSPYGAIHAYPYIYPPLYAWACQPLTHLGFLAAERVMLLVDTVVLLASFVFGARAILKHLGMPVSTEGTAWTALVTVLILIGPMIRELRTEQVNGLILLGFVLAFYWLDEHPLFAGVSLALAISIKYIPLIAIPYLLLRRRWSAVGAALLGWLFFVTLPAMTLGWSANLSYLGTAYHGLACALGAAPAVGAAHVHALTDVLNISVTSSLARLALDLRWTRATAAILALIILGAWSGVMLLMYRRRNMPILIWPKKLLQQVPPFQKFLAIEWGALIILAIAFSPNGELMLAALPLALVAALLAMGDSKRIRWRAFLVALLTGVGLLLPIAAIGHANSRYWDTAGVSCWVLLLSYLFSTSVVINSSR